MRPGSAAGSAPPRWWRWWWPYLSAFFLIAAGWALGLPANGTYDEKDHIARAYAVATGQLTSHRTVVDRRDDRKPAFLVPASLLPSNSNVDCAWSPRPARSADCQRWTDDRVRVLTPSGAARYSPVYYLLVGAPLVLAPGPTGILLARLISALAAAALLAGAVGAALQLGSRLLALGVVLTATPMAVNLAGSVNPNGLEIAAGVAVCCALLALLRTPGARLGDRAVRRLLVLAGVGSLVLLTVRQLGPVLLALIVAVCAALARPGRIAGMWRRREARWIVAGSWSLGLAGSLGWMAYSGVAGVAPVVRDAQHLAPMQLAQVLATRRIPFYLKQVIGQFGYGETKPSLVVIAAWYLLLGAVVVPSLIHGGRRLTLVAASLGAACIGLLVALELHYLPIIGWFAQGRYAMPAAAGVVLCAAGAPQFEQRLARRRRLRPYCAVLTCVAVALHLYLLAFVMTRFQSGPGARLDPFAGAWRPPTGGLLPLLAVLAGGTILVVLAVVVAGDDGSAPARAGRPRTIRSAHAGARGGHAGARGGRAGAARAG
ncbi:DUF2142 domain-containing protein [Dactylosporangium sucinum]|uniref:DUF2142 domain-containing protein n=1 Tax=Dactylosporangium sucinum TaxID=1424081 RepID=A0A917TXD2_9ACTN|nr:DUF2142 domain-containing protein [Dactylosporangium sucinum]GGM43080.1 hypothetical protein GCM10007977_050790 [Dactylosporangium sucinum]